ncbi:hypothetical protein L218DRAFT_884795 [Marasmius fiardii PR-910]|nr:hypothetical protein L218DRAFT_884795 [Marasmius fiardii PR-910]
MSDPAVAKVAFEKLVGALDHQRMVAVIFNATLLVYDVLLNLGLEIKFIWARNWSLLTVLYIIQRYLPFFDTLGVTLHHHFAPNLSPRRCTLDYTIAGWSYAVGIALSEVILTLRVWAVWKKNIPVGIGLVVFFLACWVSFYVLLEKFLSAMQFTALPLPNFRGCFISDGSHILFLNWVLLMVYDTGTLILILIPGVKTAFSPGGRSELIRVIYQDGRSTPGILWSVNQN